MLPVMNEIYKTESRVINILGLNKQSMIQDGEMRDMQNLSSDLYPILSQRGRRYVYPFNCQEPQGMIVKNDIVYVIDKKSDDYIAILFNYEGSQVSRKLNNTLPKKLAAINNKIVIFPDKKYINIESGELLNMGASVTATESSTIDTESISNTSMDFSVFAVGDAVRITGCTTEPLNNTSAVVKEVETNKLTFAENTFTAATEAGMITVERFIPQLDYVMENNNRIWGVNNENNTIYASKLGDPLNFEYYQGLSNDSYALEVGSDYDFTGICAYPTHLMFIKEKVIHKIYGSKPSSYQLTTTECYGVEEGSSKSIQIINGIAYYLSPVGVMAYDGGSYPTKISDKFGQDKYENGVAGTDGEKYYLSVEKDGENYLLVYDTRRSLWHLEDNIRVKEFKNKENKLIFITSNYILATKGESGDILADGEDQLEWYAEFGPYDEYIEKKKAHAKIRFRLKMAEGSHIVVKIKGDDDMDFKILIEKHADRKHILTVPIMPERNSKVTVRIEGKGSVEISSINRVYRIGSDR